MGTLPTTTNSTAARLSDTTHVESLSKLSSNLAGRNGAGLESPCLRCSCAGRADGYMVRDQRPDALYRIITPKLLLAFERQPAGTQATQEACGFRWKIEQLHREGKQLTGLVRCQCRKARIQRNHIGCALLLRSGSKNQRHRRVARCINSSMGCWMITSFSNSGIHRSEWLLRKFYMI